MKTVATHSHRLPGSKNKTSITLQGKEHRCKIIIHRVMEASASQHRRLIEIILFQWTQYLVLEDSIDTPRGEYCQNKFASPSSWSILMQRNYSKSKFLSFREEPLFQRWMALRGKKNKRSHKYHRI